MTEPRKKKTEKKESPGFEEALKKLETIVDDMETGELDLDAMIKQFEEGQKLITLCQNRLTEIERRVEALVKTDNGEIKTELFDEEDV